MDYNGQPAETLLELARKQGKAIGIVSDAYVTDATPAAFTAHVPNRNEKMEIARQLELLRQYPDLAGDTENRPTPVWHGVCAAILAQTQWGVTDPEILSAVACHTTGKPGMSLLDKILYLADMTCAERDFEGVEQLRRLEFEDIDRAMLAALEQSVGFVRHGGRPLDPMSAATLEDIRKTAAQKDGKVKV